MADITPDELRGSARVAGLRLLDEDIEPLTLQFNALLEGLNVLSEHDLHGIAPLPALPYPLELPAHGAATAPPPATSTDAPLPYKPITELATPAADAPDLLIRADRGVPGACRAARRRPQFVRYGYGGVGASAGGARR